MPPFTPPTASLSVVLAVFFGLLIVLDVVLVRWLRLRRVAWRRVDYIWLTFGALGLLSAVAQVRMESAAAQLDSYEKRAVVAFNSAKALVGLYASTPGAICRVFVRSQYSPPPEEFQRTQEEYNIACEWIRNVSTALKSYAASPVRRFDRSALPQRPSVSDGMLTAIFRELDQQFAYFDQHVDVFESLQQKSKRTSFEETLVYSGPFLLAIALAIRITKVTGELKLESRSPRGG